MMPTFQQKGNKQISLITMHTTRGTKILDSEPVKKRSRVSFHQMVAKRKSIACSHWYYS